MKFKQDGAERFAGALDHLQLAFLIQALAPTPADRPGVRLTGVPGLDTLISPLGVIGQIAAIALGAKAKPVRAVLFDKTAQINWSLAWHQDRTIAVKTRHDTSGFGPWSRKDGLQHVEPPFAVIEAMVTLRVHLDPVGADNAPLLILPGSHRRGRLTQPAIVEAASRPNAFACLAEAGDVWLYATPIVHASERANIPNRRRVLQLDYSAQALPEGLDWLGV